MIWIRRFLLGVAATCCIALVYFVDPATRPPFYPPCPFYALTGLYCPGCGSLRAVHEVLHGNVGGALKLNPLLVLSIPLLCLLIVFQKWRYHPSVSWVALFALLAYWILRNIRVCPFTWLAPH